MPEPAGDFRPGDSRSNGAIPQRRIPQNWPKDRRFRILSIDGGGIKGLFPATVLAELERRYLGGTSIVSYFDLVAGTSTGGIIALGLGAGLRASELADIYTCRGLDVFPQSTSSTIGRMRRLWRTGRNILLYNYERSALESLLLDALGAKLLGDSVVRLCVPAFEGKHSEVFVYKTPHHVDYKFDHLEPMVKVALATSAAPTYFRPLEHEGYNLVDGGVWANNPVMLAIVEALTCFDIDRDQIDVISLGCGDAPYIVSGSKISAGGKIAWFDIIYAAMRLQSLAATNQARLLLGPPAVRRLDPPINSTPIPLDDFRRSLDELVPAAHTMVDRYGDQLASSFLTSPAARYRPVSFSSTAN
ncbi:CBASS cGAMP-activated phospholipase [Bradyrhizobium sp. ORS 111]|uniref:CBASS cGAMP-activated phospholipase n=1 Tax=Bradyrhizobium sp. ORS 111 TaxID=1685958 RepID=UPI0038905C6E